MKKRLYAFYSKKADEICGHCLCKIIDGDIVKVTLVSPDPLTAYVIYNWDDKEFVGEVEEYIKSNTKYNNFSMGVAIQEESKNERFCTLHWGLYSWFWHR